MIAALVLATALTFPDDILILRSGQRYEISSAQQENGRIVFRTVKGELFSVSADEVDLKARDRVIAAAREEAQPQRSNLPRKFKASEAEKKRLLQELEQNHTGQPAPPLKSETASTKAETFDAKKETSDEQNWRSRAKGFRDAVRAARDHRAALQARAELARSRVEGFLAQGYKPEQFTYDTMVMQDTVAELPSADAEVSRAEQALNDFLEEARKADVPPGWVR